MPLEIRAVVVDPSLPDWRSARSAYAILTETKSLSGSLRFRLNRGETRRALQIAGGLATRLDFAGVVETTAADGSGPKPGTRVVGILPSGAWADRVNCRSHAVAGRMSLAPKRTGSRTVSASCCSVSPSFAASSWRDFYAGMKGSNYAKPQRRPPDRETRSESDGRTSRRSPD